MCHCSHNQVQKKIPQSQLVVGLSLLLGWGFKEAWFARLKWDGSYQVQTLLVVMSRRRMPQRDPNSHWNLLNLQV